VVDEEDRRSRFDDPLQPAPEILRLLRVEPGGGLVMQTSCGRAARARAALTSLRWPWLISVGMSFASSLIPSTSSANCTFA